jgi:hypothetical protein
MSEQIDQSRHPLSRAERKQLLALACVADRAAWVYACRPAPPSSPVVQIANNVMGYLEPFLGFLPGRVGRWIRGARVVTSVVRQFGWLSR